MGDTAAEYKLFLFDIQMFTRLTLNDTPSPLLTATHSTGVQVTGATSNAIGFIFSTETSETDKTFENERETKLDEKKIVS